MRQTDFFKKSQPPPDMALRNKMWRKVDRKDNVLEYLCTGEFIQSDEWNSSSSSPKFIERDYGYHKDGFDFRGNSYTFDNKINVTEITHATSCQNMLSIISEGGFRSKEKLYPDIGVTSLVWFGLNIGEEKINCVKENSKSRVQALMQDNPLLEANADEVTSKITHNPAFQPMSRYGHFKFILIIKDVLTAYKAQFCASSSEPEIRKLGTFAYKQETMHAILVCSPDTPGTDKCPPLSDDPVVQPDEMFETWTWKPDSTGCQHISFTGSGFPLHYHSRWEHVVFAFYVPQGSLLKIDNLKHCLSLCLATVQYVKINEDSSVQNGICMMLDSIASTDDRKKKSLADTLIRMIAGYLHEERLYEKTMIKESYEKYAHVELELVLQRLQILLPPSEFRNLNWYPLEAWRNSLTIHSNVLHVIEKLKPSL